jgi:hypothetical protein
MCLIGAACAGKAQSEVDSTAAQVLPPRHASSSLQSQARQSSSASCCPLSCVAYVPDEVKRMTNDVQAPVFSALGVKNFAVATP